MSVSPVDFDSVFGSVRSNPIPNPYSYSAQQLQQAIAQHQQTNDKAKIQITLRPIDNGYLLTIEHKGVKHERSVIDFSEIGAQVMVALAAINLEG